VDKLFFLSKDLIFFSKYRETIFGWSTINVRGTQLEQNKMTDRGIKIRPIGITL
jgi:hypothetical protein